MYVDARDHLLGKGTEITEWVFGSTMSIMARLPASRPAKPASDSRLRPREVFQLSILNFTINFRNGQQKKEKTLKMIKRTEKKERRQNKLLSHYVVSNNRLYYEFKYILIYIPHISLLKYICRYYKTGYEEYSEVFSNFYIEFCIMQTNKALKTFINC